MPISSRHILLISRQSASHSVRSGTGLVFLLMTLMYGLSMASIILWPVELAKAVPTQGGKQLTTDQAVELISKESKPLLIWGLGGKPRIRGYDMAEPGTGVAPSSPDAARAQSVDEWATFLLEKRPGMLSGIFILLLIGIPLLIPVVAFNQIAGDVQTKGLRYLLLRTERANIFFGRFIGTAVFTIGVMAVLIATIAFYIGVKIQIYDTGPLTMWALQGFLALAAISLPYIAVCTLLSANLSSPFLSLVTCGLIIGGVPLFALLAEWRWKPTGQLRYLLPWAWQNELLHFDWTHIALALAACVGYTAVFLAIGYWRFERRDL